MPRQMFSPEWGKTMHGVDRLRGTPFFEEGDAVAPHGYYKKRRIIGHDTPINGGVYVGGGMREAIVVDDQKEKSKILAAYEEFIRRADENSPNRLVRQVGLNDIYNFVLEKMPYDSALVNRIAAKLREGHSEEEDVKVALDSYLNGGGGVCRHQGLFAAYLIEKLIADGTLKGSVSVNRNVVPGMGGHAWVQFTNPAGERFIVDPAQKYVGRLEDVDEDTAWFYERPEDA